jgi:hypothetical protein
MIVTIAFDVLNYVEVMEAWPIKFGDTTFLIERDGNVLKRVCLSFSGVGLEHAPRLTSASDAEAHLQIGGDDYIVRARKAIMNWQAVVSGMQVISLDYDCYEMRFHAETFEEHSKISVHSLKTDYDKSLNASCDFEQIGRAFCVGQISDDRIESTAHFRDGRIAFASGRYVDAYNNMFLFIETRYCDGKTSLHQQVNLLINRHELCEIIENNHQLFLNSPSLSEGGSGLHLFKTGDGIKEKIQSLVLLRGRLRHHSLKSPMRWDPNDQEKYKDPARFLSAVVGDIVMKESVGDIYSPAALAKFKEISTSTGFETKLTLMTYRTKREPALTLNISFPTTVVSSRLCLNTVREAIKACEKSGQLADTVRFEAIHGRTGLHLLSLEFGVWAYTDLQSIVCETPNGSIRCSFEIFQSGSVVKHEFSLPAPKINLGIRDLWIILNRTFDHIEERDPTTRIIFLQLFINERRTPMATYRVGAIVKN